MRRDDVDEHGYVRGCDKSCAELREALKFDGEGYAVWRGERVVESILTYLLRGRCTLYTCRYTSSCLLH